MTPLRDRHDVIVVGAGPAGIAAALVLARRGVDVAVLERGPQPGSKNLAGEVLHTSVLAELVGDFADTAPLQRQIIRRRFALLSGQDQLALDFSSFDWAPPHNHSYTILRGEFDPWFASRARAAGAMILPETAATELVIDDGLVVGVRTDRESGELRAGTVIVADGCNSFLARKHGYRRDFNPHRLQLAAKEVIRLDRDALRQRFNLTGRQGAAIDYLGGDALMGLAGGGFIYTNSDTLSVGVNCVAGESSGTQAAPHAVLEHFKAHPAVAPLLAGGEVLESFGHMLPTFDAATMPKPFGDGVVFVGDAGGLASPSPLHHDGMRLAMESGRAAAETVLELREEGKPFTAEHLARYAAKLECRPTVRDAARRGQFSEFARRHPQFFDAYPKLFNELARDFFAADGRPRRQVDKRLFKRFRKEVGLLRFVREAWKAFRAMR